MKHTVFVVATLATFGVVSSASPFPSPTTTHSLHHLSAASPCSTSGNSMVFVYDQIHQPTADEKARIESFSGKVFMNLPKSSPLVAGNSEVFVPEDIPSDVETLILHPGDVVAAMYLPKRAKIILDARSVCTKVFWG